jgi:hypothetical protein
VARALDGDGDEALVLGAGASLATRADLTPVAHESPEHIYVLVFNLFVFVHAELADVHAAHGRTAPAVELFFSTLIFVIATFVIHSRASFLEWMGNRLPPAQELEMGGIGSD